MNSDRDFEQVLRDYGPALRRFVAARERDPAAREDLLQEILFALWRALPRFRGDASEKTFIYRVANNRALTHHARRHAGGDPLDAAAELPDLGPSPEEAADRTLRRERLLHALQKLPAATSQILTLSLEGLSGADIADVLGITENNAAVRLTRARKALAEEMTR